jgi:hypothetical protein
LTDGNIKITYKHHTFQAEHTSLGFFSGNYYEERTELNIKRKSGWFPFYYKTILSMSKRSPHSVSLDLGRLDGINLDDIVKDPSDSFKGASINSFGTLE